MVTSPRGLPAIESNALISDLIVYEPPNLSLAAVRRISDQLKSRDYQLSINVSEKIWAYLIPFFAAIPVRIGFSPGYTQPFKALMVRGLLTHAVQYLNIPSKPMGAHEVERQLRLLEPLGIRSEGRPLSVTLRPDDIEWARLFLKERGLQGAGRKSDGKALVAFHLSHKWLLEGWDMHTLSLFIASLLPAMKDSAVVVTYSDVEMPWAKQLLDEMDDPRLIACHSNTFGKWASILASADLLITMDTSASHLASALRLPVVDVFHERWYGHCTERWHPWRVPYRLVEKRTVIPEPAGPQRKKAAEELAGEVIRGMRDMMKWESI